MLSHLNYLFPQYPTQAASMTANSNSANKQKPAAEAAVATVLQSPKLNGPADHVAFVIHGIGQVRVENSA
jgi:hypothetical protein